MPENRLRPNTIQILRNIESFRERLKQNKAQLKPISIEDVPQQETQIKIKIEQPVAAEQEPKRFVNSRGRGYNPHFTWGLNGPLTFDDGGNI